jgi:hypothetical protein
MARRYAVDSFKVLAARVELRAGVDPELAGLSLVALMDGLQVQWLSNGAAVDLVGALRPPPAGSIDRPARRLTCGRGDPSRPAGVGGASAGCSARPPAAGRRSDSSMDCIASSTWKASAPEARSGTPARIGPGQLQHAGAPGGRMPFRGQAQAARRRPAGAAASGPSKRFGSGSTAVPSVPAIRGVVRGSAESNVSTICAGAAPAELSSAVTVVGTVTGELRTGSGPGADHPGLAGPATGRGDPADRAQQVHQRRSGSTGPCPAADRRRPGRGTPARDASSRARATGTAPGRCAARRSGRRRRPAARSAAPAPSTGVRCARPPGGRVRGPGPSSLRADGRSSASGFSAQTCLPASSAARPTSTWAAGDGEVDDELDRRDRRAVPGRCRRRDAVFRGLRGGPAGVQVGDHPDVQVGKLVRFFRYVSLMVPAPTTPTRTGPVLTAYPRWPAGSRDWRPER